jgi:hypothetical protein
MTTNTRMFLRIAIPLALLLSPFLLGYPILLFVQSTTVFILSALVPQYALWPYCSYYYPDSGNSPLAAWQLFAVAVHWVVVFAAYLFVTRNMSLLKSLGVFLLLGALSILAVHGVFLLLGCRFYLETI